MRDKTAAGETATESRTCLVGRAVTALRKFAPHKLLISLGRKNSLKSDASNDFMAGRLETAFGPNLTDRAAPPQLIAVGSYFREPNPFCSSISTGRIGLHRTDQLL